ncbi:MAG TPA: RES family NAD+ phosphorylase [Candidatus Angelobacter sp.]
MNVEGVVVFYGALDEQTCLAETRPAIGNDIAVVKMRTTRPLRLLDFGRLEQSYKLLSYFQADFTEEVERGAFLRRLQNLISQPVVPGREMDYLITQTMAEYLGHVHDPKFDGVVHKSVQRFGGKNIVLFQNEDGGFPLKYVDKSFGLFSNSSVEYKHRKRYVGEFEDGKVWVGHDFDDDED